MDQPLVGILMGSKSDLPVMQRAVDTLSQLGVPFEVRVLSAHRMPEMTVQYGREAEGRGLRVIIAGAGMAAALPGMLAALTLVPVLGVPLRSAALMGLDSLLSMVQMPGGVPVGTLAIGEAGATNAALLAAQILAAGDPALRERLWAYRDKRAQEAMASFGDPT
jgi:5-(carboxyamino)imidazole ribonucleotide mutase